MSTEKTWEPFGIPDEEYDQAPARNGVRVLNLSMPRRPREAGQGDRSAAWLRCAMLALGLLACAAAAVSFEAQFRMVFAAKGIQWAAALEAAIPDVAALVFASLGIALALHGKRAIRARVLNVGAVATSIAMNLLAAAPGWRNLAIWIMPPIAYALASDTAIGVIRAYALARQRELREALAEDETTPLAILAGVALWTLRLVLAPPSTLSGFRRWVVESCPVAPGRRALPAVTDVTALPAAPDAGQRGHHHARIRSRPARARRSHRGRGVRAARARRPGSWHWSRSATASWPGSTPPRSPGSAVISPRRSA